MRDRRWPGVPAERSRTMQAVRGKGNRSTELRLRDLLRAARLSGWRRHLPLPGRPDFAWRAERVAVFVDGCFWHGCPVCSRAPPATNEAFWRHKIEANQRRDRRITRQLRKDEWSVIRVWEHSLKHPNGALARIARALDARRRQQSAVRYTQINV
jgi:DNA mismatch endonuclease, patch repair protein